MFDFFEHLNSPKFVALKQNFVAKRPVAVIGQNVWSQAFVLSGLGEGMLIVAKDLVSASKMAQSFVAMGKTCEILTTPFENALGLEDRALKDDFFAAIGGFATKKVDFLIVLSGVLFQRAPSRESVLSMAREFEKGKEYDFLTLSKMLVSLGYEKKDGVFSRGEFMVKGDTLTVWPVGQENLVRLEFFDDFLEKISLINPDTKKFAGKLEKVCVLARELALTKGNLLEFSEAVAFEEPIVLEGQINAMEDAENFVPKNMVFKTYPKRAVAFFSMQAKTFFKPEEVLRIEAENGKNFARGFKDFIEELRFYMGSEKQVFVFCGSKERKKHLEKTLEENFVFVNTLTTEPNIHILEDFLPQTIKLLDAGSVMYGTYNLFGKEMPKKTGKKAKIFVPSVGDFVVHDVHGIGKCVGLEKMRLAGYEKEYIIIEYLGGDRFYLPSEQANALSLYSAGAGGSSGPKLNRLGGADFARAKEKVYKSVREMAFDLLKLYARREKAKGKVYDKDDYLMQKFEEAFGFQETPDQLSAISDIKADMESPRIMDRLVCGDVGFGKTEVALRAIYKAVLSGSQVAFLCPTTILAQQHYQTCLKRFAGFMVKTARFNRLMKKSEETEVLKGLRDGSINVVVGTHKLLSKNVQFKNLTLLVLDEEQRFGVEDKEKIKNMKESIDVLSLSATPIPRTLHMALSGIRDLSLIETAPRQRQPVQTFVTEFDAGLVQKAIGQELARNGQVLIIFNNIEKIFDFAGKIRALCPGANVGVAHGRMSPKSLEDAIFKLYTGEYNVLVSTTLIENGVDLPSANTLIVVDADKLGLSQAYQIRGRIGRSDKVAYAYFLVKEGKEVSENAYRRLSALMENTSLGSGIKIAMADLDIRGAGNVLGKEQSGNMIKVGYDLYYKLLSLALREAKGEKVAEKREVKIEVPLSALVPENFVASEDVRLRIISEIAAFETRAAAKEYLENLAELYGKVPVEVENLAKISLLKNFAQAEGVRLVKINADGIKIAFYEKNDVLEPPKGSVLESVEWALGIFEKQNA